MAFGDGFRNKKHDGNTSKGIKLPGVLLDEIKGKHENDNNEVDDHYSLNNNSGKKSKRKASAPISRKEKRREERNVKKQKQIGAPLQQAKLKQRNIKGAEKKKVEEVFNNEDYDKTNDTMMKLAKLKAMKSSKSKADTTKPLKIVKMSELDLDEVSDDDDINLDEDDFGDFDDFVEEKENSETFTSAEDTMAALKALKVKKNKKTAEPQTVEDTMAALKAIKDKKNKKTAEPQTVEDTMAALKALKDKKNKKTAEPQTVEDTMAALKALKDKKNKKTAEPQTVEDTMAALKALKDKRKKDSEPKSAQDALSALKALKEKKKADKQAEKVKKAKKNEEKLDIDPFEYNSMRRDELDIAHYAKMLGLKGKQRHRLPPTTDEDGLNDILDGLELDYGFSDNEKKSKYTDSKQSESESESDEEEKKEDIKLPFSSDDELDSDDFDDLSESDIEGLGDDDEESDSEDGGEEKEEDEEINGGDSEEEEEYDEDEEEEDKPQKENPYVAPVSADSAGKYIPPSVRRRMMQESGAGAEQSEEIIRLRRQAKGLFNRLSESNIGSILGELEQLYLRNARGNVTQVIVSILIESTAIPGNLLESFLILHAALATALYRTMGIEFGAALIQSLVENFDKYFLSESTQKEASNLLSLLSELYTFQLISCNLMYDFIRLFLDDINERKTEYLLKIVRNSGAQLRTDDPAALRDIITLLQVSVTKVGQDQINTRTKFLIESIHALKNNRQKNTSEINNSAVIRMKKFLGGIVGRTNEPIRVSLADIRDVETRGKWWLVGAAWRNNGSGTNRDEIQQDDADFTAVNDLLDTAEPNWVELAREQRMNTDIRRAVFIAIMGSEDYLNACERLQKLRLKRIQEREIPRVILRCCGNEKVYNPFYALVAGKLCEQQHSLKMTLQFCLWDYFHELEGDEDSDEDSDKDEFEDLMNTKEDEDEETKLRKILNLSRFYASIVSDGAMSLAIFKNVNFLTAKTELRLFMEFFFVSFLQSLAKKAEKANGPRPKGSSKMFEVKRDDKVLIQMLAKCRENPTLLRGIQYFLQTYVLISDSVEKPKEKERVKWAVDLTCDVVDEFLMSA